MSEPCRCERADAIKSLVSIANIVEKVSHERDEALLALARVRWLADQYDLVSETSTAQVASDLRAAIALEPTDQPKGKP